jgi:hypothetical protein
MTSDEFVTWLKGFLQALQSDRPEIKVILDKVAFVTSNTHAIDVEALKQKARIHTETPPVCHPYPLKNYLL